MRSPSIINSTSRSWTKIGAFWYHFTDVGILNTGWFLEGGKWYFLHPDGHMQTGWYNPSGTIWYYFGTDGAMRTGWQQIKGNWYFFEKTNPATLGQMYYGGAFVIGIPSALGFGVWSGVTPLGMDILSFFDFLTNSVIMPIVAILTCLVVCYVMKPKAVVEEIALSGKFKLEKLFRVMIYVAPVLLLIILAFAIFEAFGITFGGFLKF